MRAHDVQSRSREPRGLHLDRDLQGSRFGPFTSKAYERSDTLLSQSVCGMGVVRDYYMLQKFNVMEIAKTEEPGFKEGEGRVSKSASGKPAVVAEEPETPVVE